MLGRSKLRIVFLTSTIFGLCTIANAQDEGLVCVPLEEGVASVAAECPEAEGVECACPVGFVLVDEEAQAALIPSNTLIEPDTVSAD